MDERVVKFRVGVMVLATLFIAGILVLLFSDVRWTSWGGYVLHIHFAEAPGVTEGTPVRKSGILIGRVTKVRFADRGGVDVDVKVDPQVKLYRDEVPQVSGSLLGGDVVIQFYRRAATSPPPQPRAPTSDGAVAGEAGTLTAANDGDEAGQAKPPAAPPAMNEKPEELVHDGDYIEGTVAPNAIQAFGNLEGDLKQAIDNLSTAGTEVGKLAASMNKLLDNNDEQISRIVNKTESVIDTFQTSLNNLDDVIGDKDVRDNLKNSIRELPQLFTDTRETVNTMQATLESVDRNMRNLEGFTGPLGDRGDQIIDNIDKALSRFDSLLVEMSDFGRKLNSGEGTLGELMRNPELYQHLNAAALNVERLTCKLRPILDDARVFSDKIARDPGVIGVRGVLQRRTSIK